ncbi:hypothetical protein [Croceibacterium ferulae]|nr:hypothetical protein [Croceibacterium ferulae]
MNLQHIGSRTPSSGQLAHLTLTGAPSANGRLAPVAPSLAVQDRATPPG